MDNWQPCAQALSTRILDSDSRWLTPVAETARHRLVPRWWDRDAEGQWVLRDGSADPDSWLENAYADRSLITSVAGLHADHATLGDRPHGLPTSSATLPSLVVRMLRHARIGDGLSLLDLGTGAGGLTAYACHRLGEQHVTSLDVDPYLVSAATKRLAAMGHHPRMVTADATEHVPGAYDRIVCTVALPPGAGLASVIRALKPGGRIATTLANTTLIVTGWKNESGEVVGQVERDMAGFMLTRSAGDYPPANADLFHLARTGEGDVSKGRYPVVDVNEAWELRSMLEITTPGVEIGFESSDRMRTTTLIHPDGSWARATAEWTDPPEVHQGGPQRLWQALERIRNRLNTLGSLPLLGAKAVITTDGAVHLSRGRWQAAIGEK
ncbi:methyltransferase domain-containing protein [Streptomyces albidoflavus]